MSGLTEAAFASQTTGFPFRVLKALCEDGFLLHEYVKVGRFSRLRVHLPSLLVHRDNCLERDHIISIGGTGAKWSHMDHETLWRYGYVNSL